MRLPVDDAWPVRRRGRRPEGRQVAPPPLGEPFGWRVEDGARQPRLAPRHRGRGVLGGVEAARDEAVELHVPSTGTPNQTEIALAGLEGEHRSGRCSFAARSLSSAAI